MTAKVAGMLARARHVLLDFDGPVCAVFGGAITGIDAVERACRVLGAEAGRLPADVRDGADPLAVLRCAGLDYRGAVETAITRAELEAITTAPLTPGAREAIAALVHSGFTVTIVSNNSAAAVDGYVDRNGLGGQVTGIVARTFSDPKLLKPSPHLVELAVRARGVAAGACVLIGDSVSDVQAARTTGTASIGYANKHGKSIALSAAGADSIVTTMTEIADAARSFTART